MSNMRRAASVSHGRRRSLVDQVAVAEAFDVERRIDGMRLVLGDGPGEDMRRARRGLEAAGAPTAVDIQAGDGCLADDGRAVRRYIDDAAPIAHHAQAAEVREQFA